MSIQSAIVFGLILGVTFFLVYLSILAHRDQGIINSPSAQGGHLLENLLANKLDNAQDISKPTGVLPDTKQNDIQIVSLSKAELSLLRKDHSAITTSTDVSMSKTTSTSSKKKSIPTEDEREDQRKNELLKKMKKEKISKFNELSPEIACMRMKKKFHVVPNISWGTLPTELQQKWSELNCDHHLPSDHSGTHSHEEENQPEENQRTNESEQKKQEQQPSTEKDSDEEFCWANRKKYQVQPMKSWGNLPLPLIEQWKQRNCDAVFTRQRLNSMPLTNCRHIPNHYSNKDLPLIALMAATTTRKVMQPSTKKLALFLYLLPSFARTVDCGFRYEYILGYDVGDPYYDNDAGIKEVKEWFYKNIEKPLKENAISLTLRLVKVKNTLKKPGPVFNEMARVAYSQSNATYFYRVNDDTELLTHWPTIFVKGIHALSIPYGVIGPWCNQGNEKILTHDFVHRIHMEIFEMNYYPPQLTDWWMDDWISFVYGQTRTFKASVVKVIHHTGAHGQRYTVDETHFHLLGDLIKEGRQKIRKYMLKNNIPESILKVFDKDVFQAGFLHRDLPKLQ